MGTLELFDLSGKAAIVTGGGRGLGFALAEALAQGDDIDAILEDLDPTAAGTAAGGAGGGGKRELT